MEWEVPLCRPTFAEEDLKALVDAYRSGWLTMGPRAAELGEAICEYTGADHAVPVSSCSAALHLACLAAELGPGDEVVAPALTFISTVSAISHVGATPRFADIAAPDRPWLSVESVEAAISESTKAIVTMAYGGHLGETAEIARLAEERGLILIEDAAHATGSRLHGRHAGTFGTVGTLSFSSSKNLGIGEGGMLISNDTEFAVRAAHQSWHGVGSQAWSRHKESAPSYALGTIGFNYRFDDPRAALVISVLDRLDAENARRGEIVARYREAFDAEELIEPTAAAVPAEQSSHCLFTATFAAPLDRDELRRKLAARGVQTSVHYPLLHKAGLHAQPEVRLPVTEDYAARCVTLPLFPTMQERQIELVIDAVHEALADPVAARAA